MNIYLIWETRADVLVMLSWSNIASLHTSLMQSDKNVSFDINYFIVKGISKRSVWDGLHFRFFVIDYILKICIVFGNFIFTRQLEIVAIFGANLLTQPGMLLSSSFVIAKISGTCCQQAWISIRLCIYLSSMDYQLILSTNDMIARFDI